MSGRLDGRGVLITGGASGIGRATALRCAGDGARVAVMDRDAALVDEVVAELRATGATAVAATADVGDETQVAAAVASAVEALGGLQGVVTSAGISSYDDMVPVEDIPLDVFLTILRVNLVGTFLAIKHTLPHLVRDGGAIVTIASTAALNAAGGAGAGYTASKGGVDALTRMLARRYGPDGVRANCVCPGGTVSPMTRDAFSSPEAVERARKTIPLGRYAQPDDIAKAVAFLLSDDAGHVTGHTMPVEGGMLIV